MARPRKQHLELRTFGGDLAHAIRERAANHGRIQWPDDRYIRDPVAFFEDILGVEVWSGGPLTGMKEVLEAFRDNRMIAIKAGRRVSKSYVAAGLALLLFASYHDGKAMLVSSTDDQVELVLYKTIREMWARSGTCLRCRKAGVRTLCEHSAKLDGDLGPTHASGVKDPRPENQRSIFARAAKSPEGFQGFGHPHMIVIVDEAASMPSENLLTLEAGIQASGGWFMPMGNPRVKGGAYEALFHPDSEYTKLTIPSTASPNYQANDVIIPGLATREWIEKKIKQHGEKSAFVQTNIYGEFPSNSTLQPFSRERLLKAVINNKAEAKGRLHIGLDPASYGAPDGRNDLSGLCCRRGFRVLELTPLEDHTPKELLDEVLRLIEEHGSPREVPVLNIDAEGDVGYKVSRAFREYLIDHPNAYELWSLRVSEKAKRDPKIYDRQRDCMLGNLDRYLREGGGIPDDERLIEEVQAMGWMVNHRGLSKATDKKLIRKAIGRSPDLADALILSCWQAPGIGFEAGAPTNRPSPPPRDPRPPGLTQAPRSGGMSPYGAEAKWRRR